MNKKILYLALIALFAATGCTLKQASNTAVNGNSDDAMTADEAVDTGEGMTVADALVYTDLAPKEAKELIDNSPNLVVIDVSPVYAEGHLPGAVSYVLGDGSLDSAIPTLDKKKDYLVYCHAESASRAGAQKLIDAGFENVYRLDGEYGSWIDAGYPIEK